MAAVATQTIAAPGPPLWSHGYNWARPHGSIGTVPPICRSGPTENNLLEAHS